MVNTSRQLFALVAAFSAFGVLFGTWQVLVNDLINALGLSPAQIGISISWGLVGSIPAMFIANRIAKRIGLRLILLSSSIVIALMLANLATITSYVALFRVLFLLFGMAGVYDMTINAAAIALKAFSPKGFLIYLHAIFSGAAAFSAVVIGLLLNAGVSYKTLFFGGALMTGGLGLIATLLLGNLNLTPSQMSKQHQRKANHSTWNSTMFLIVVIAVIANLAQGAIENWSAIYLRTTLTYTALLGASGVAIFHTAMLIGRISTGVAIKHLNISKFIVVAGGATSMGIALTLLNISSFITLSGILLMGIALATIQPIAFILAGANMPNRANEASTLITTTSYIGLLVGPILIGGIAEFTSLKVALSSIGLIGFLIMLFGQCLSLAHLKSGSK